MRAISYPPHTGGEGTAVDKEWIACDNFPSSPFFGHCYVAYTDIAHSRPGQEANVAVQSTSDGGVTWSQPLLFPVEAEIVSPGVQPVVRPNGELVIVFFEDGVVRATALDRRRRDVLGPRASGRLAIPPAAGQAEPAPRLHAADGERRRRRRRVRRVVRLPLPPELPGRRHRLVALDPAASLDRTAADPARSVAPA